MNEMRRLHQERRAILRGSLRHSLRTLAAAGPLFVLGRLAAAAPAPSGALVEVWKSPTCGCCKDWIAHMETRGFRVRVHETGNTSMRQRLGIPAALGSCHTALVGGYAIEGHVPAVDVMRLLAEKPAAAGLAVPGMPVGSPGMDGAVYGGRRDAYDVLLVAKDGGMRVFASYR
ncbi:MAG: DUF411 domain-containing protein [Rubrivivax sp.]